MPTSSPSNAPGLTPRERAAASPSVNVESFGFKYGVPAQVDLLFDVRFLPNPYFVDELRHKDGRSKEVQEFLAQTELPAQFMGRLEDFLEIKLAKVPVRPETIGRWKQAEGQTTYDFLQEAMVEYGYLAPEVEIGPLRAEPMQSKGLPLNG